MDREWRKRSHSRPTDLSEKKKTKRNDLLNKKKFISLSLINKSLFNKQENIYLLLVFGNFHFSIKF